MSNPDSASRDQVAPEPPSPVSLREALRFWLKLGFISFGGPAGQIAIMHQELVERRRWISERRFLHALNYCMLLPGPEAQQLATYIGWLMHRTWGGIVAGALFVLPSLFILIALSWVYIAFGDVPLVAGLFYGIKPAVTAIVRARRAPHRLARAEEQRAVGDRGGVLRGDLRPQRAVPGHRCGRGADRLRRRPRRAGEVPRRRRARRRDSILRSGADRRRHADARSTRAFAGPGCCAWCSSAALLWLVPMGLLTTRLRLGSHADADGLVLHQGGAADLRRRLCGAALRVPGRGRALRLAHADADDRRPGARRDHAGAADHGGGLRRLRRRLRARRCSARQALFLAGAVAASLVTWFTFLPSFLFILAGGPLVESTHGDLKFTAPLDGHHRGRGRRDPEPGAVLRLPRAVAAGFRRRLRLGVALIALGAAIALFRFKRGVIEVIAACAVLGLAVRTLFA